MVAKPWVSAINLLQFKRQNQSAAGSPGRSCKLRINLISLCKICKRAVNTSIPTVN